MADYTRLTPQDLDTILAAYDLGELVFARPLTGGQANSSYQLTCATGTYTLSVCDEKTADEIHALVQLLLCLGEQGFPTTRPVLPVLKGAAQGLFVRFDDKPVYIKTFLPGELVRELTPAMTAQVGAAMADLHGTALPRQVEDALPQAFPYGFARFDEVIRAGLDHEFPPWLQDKKDWLSGHLDLAMPKGLIHGDIFWDNLLFEGGRLSAVLDFEEACRYYCLFDLGMAVVGCCSDSGRLVMENLHGLLLGYQSQRPLSDSEKEQFRPFLVYAATAAAFWRFRQYHLRRPDPDKQESYKALSDLADQAQTLTARDFFKG